MRFTFSIQRYEHQLSAHVSSEIPRLDYCGSVDGIKVPIPHFGCLLDNQQFTLLRQRIESADIEYVVKPQTRYEGQKGEQSTMFVLDHSGNPLEFKSFKNADSVFAS